MKTFCSGLVRGAGFLMAIGMLAIEARADQLAGIVQSVNADTNKMVVKESGTDKNVDIMLNGQTRLVTNAGQPLGVKDLKRGDGVGIAYSDGLASSIIVNQGILRGIVDSINLDDKKMVVNESGTDRDVEVPLKDETVIETGTGKVLELKNIKTGDGVGIAYAGKVPTKIVVNQKPPEVKGHIESVAADLKSVIIKELGSNAKITVTINPKTSIVTTTGKSLEIKDLKKGDGVAIAHDSSVASKVVVDVASPR